MVQPILIIDPGHGGKDGGGGSNEFFKEKDMNLKISLYQFKRFTELSVPVAITRSEDIYLSPSNRTDKVKESGAKICISNHINAASLTSARGVETIYSIYSDGKLARKLLDAVENEGMPERRAFSKESATVSGKDYYYMHRDTGAVETIIIEYGFATNEIDTQLIINNWERYAEAVVKAICEHINHKYVPATLPEITGRANIKLRENILPAYITNEGKSYVEVRALANMLDLEITWDSVTKTVILKER